MNQTKSLYHQLKLRYKSYYRKYTADTNKTYIYNSFYLPSLHVYKKANLIGSKCVECKDILYKIIHVSDKKRLLLPLQISISFSNNSCVVPIFSCTIIR